MKIPVLLYHSISNDNSPMSLNINFFENQMKYLKNNGFQTVDFNEIDPNLKSKKQIIITFDDGYKDILNNALPILKKYNFKATSFFVTNLIGQNNSWDVKKKSYIKKEIMNPSDILQWISSGMHIGSHSHNHVDLTKISEEKLLYELEFSKKFLEDKFDNKNNIFCYPYGKVNENVHYHTKKFYSKAVTTNRSRYSLKRHNTHLIPRIDMGKNFSSFKLYLKLETIYEDIKYKKNELYL
tara:strand:+ start:761 stop:1477 length:717 start_codon:yes stop_codon:yes gene_type:complete